MLGIHDRMKSNEHYQCLKPSSRSPGATWASSHAAMSGQFAFEQTFYLPVDAMQDPIRSPYESWNAW